MVQLSGVVGLLAFTANTLATSSTSDTPIIPITYRYGGYPKFETDVRWGTPAGTVVPTIVDTGSPAYWVYERGAIINDGSSYHYSQGPCNKTVKTFFDWRNSTTASGLTSFGSGRAYAYGGNGKIVWAHSSVNDTFHFANSTFDSITNTQVALSNFTLVTQLDEGCKIDVSVFDQSILGLAPLTSTNGPSFLANLRDTGKIQSQSFSLWVDEAPQSVKTPNQGAAVFGALPLHKKYAGDLVRIKVNYPNDSYVGYYSQIPKLSTYSPKQIGQNSSASIPPVDATITRCLLDTGTGQDALPFSAEQVIKNTPGLIQLTNPYYVLAWNDTCENIPRSAAFKFTFEGSTPGKNVTINVPIRNYARGQYDELDGHGYDSTKYCALNVELDASNCIFAAPFFTAAFTVFHNDMNQIAFAQGGVSRDTQTGTGAIGPVVEILANKDIPGSV